MPSTIEIKDKDKQGAIAVELKHLLNLLVPEGQQLCWHIFELEATGELEGGKNMLDLEQEVRQSVKGLPVSWSELNSVAQHLFQVINATVIGFKNADAAKQFQSNDDIYSLGEIVLEMIDSTLWSVYARDDKIIERLRRVFHDTVINVN